jgi:hypothetical protein
VAAFGIGAAESTAYAIVIRGLLWLSTTASGLPLLSATGFGSALQLQGGRREAGRGTELQTEQAS